MRACYSFVPHREQKRLRSLIAAPQVGQLPSPFSRFRGVPQRAQKRAPGRAAVPQDVQRVGVPAAGGGAEGRGVGGGVVGREGAGAERGGAVGRGGAALLWGAGGRAAGVRVRVGRRLMTSNSPLSVSNPSPPTVNPPMTSPTKGRARLRSPSELSPSPDPGSVGGWGVMVTKATGVGVMRGAGVAVGESGDGVGGMTAAAGGAGR